MGNLRSLNLRPAYFSYNDNILEDFYIPCLSNSKFYNRISGYFSSNALAVAAVGFGNFIKNGGKMKLICNVYLSNSDSNIIKKILVAKEQEIIDDIENITNELKKNHIKMLGWLLKTGRLEMKIAVLSGDAIEHQKVGILEDVEGNKIAFYGSDNETKHGWLFHDEGFHIARSWEEGEIDHLLPEINNFESLWNSKDIGERLKVYDVSEAFKQNLIRKAPVTDSEFEILNTETTEQCLQEYRKRFKSKSKEIITLTKVQNEAVEAWNKKGYSGIIAMATGAGKTYVGCECIKKLLEKNNKLGIVIVTPQNSITYQWINHDIINFDLDGFEIYGANKKNISKLYDSILDVKNSHKNYFIVGTTYETFSKKKFIDPILKCDFPLLLIADEVHSAGTDIRSVGLLENYIYRLGLSATPRRRDDEGTELIYKYFYKNKYDEKKGDTYKFTMKQAIHEVNPLTKKTYLTHYTYHPYLCELTSYEYTQYKEYSKKMAQAHIIANKTSDFKYYNHLTNLRKDIVKNARNKIIICEKILNDMGQVDHCLFFLDTESQIDDMCKVLDSKFHEINYKIFTSRELKDLDEKIEVLQDFHLGKYNLLLSIGCFNEGINVPSTRTAVFVASSTNPREFIQRRGRVLRHSPGKQRARIYDIIVTPPRGVSPPSNIPLPFASLNFTPLIAP